MDKDEYFRILEDVALFNMENFTLDPDWTMQSTLSQIYKKEEKEFNFEAVALANENEQTKANRIEMNTIKYYDSTLDETTFYEKIKKENDERKADTAFKFASINHQHLDEYYDRKIQFFEKAVNSNAFHRFKYNKLNFHTNNNLEKYSFLTSFQDTCPGLKPASNWPMSLDDLLQKLSTVNKEEIFHQPFDINADFHNEALNFIKKFFNILNAEEKSNSEDENKIYGEYLTKSIQALLVIKILEGNFFRLYDTLNLFKILNSQNEKLFNKIFIAALSNSNSGESLVKTKLNELISLYKDNNSELYPIMRNYSLIDYFNISKNLLFAPSRHSFSTCSSITTDSKFLYIILSGINGGMFKIGTGNEKTTRGKVYLYEKLPNLPSVEESTFQWVFIKGKLYLKTIVSSFNLNVSKDLGHLNILNPDTFQIEGQTKLLLPESSKHPLLKKKNENYILMTDGENLNVLILEPVLKDSETKHEELDSEDEDAAMTNFELELTKSQYVNVNKDGLLKKTKTLGKNPTEVQYPADIFSYMNLMLYTFPVDHNKKGFVEKEQNSIKLSQVNEIYESFSHLYSKEECKRALILNNWNVSKTAVYLVENEKEMKQPILISESSCLLFQTKLEATISKNSRSDFKIIKNSIFDTTQFDLLKWSITADFVLAYKLKEGACVLFSRNPNDVKDFKYSYNERNPNSCGSMYSPGFFLKERDSQLLYGQGLSSEDNFDRKLLEDSILKEVWQGQVDKNSKKEDLIPFKEIKEFIEFGGNSGSSNLGFADIKDIKDLKNKITKERVKDMRDMNPFKAKESKFLFNPFAEHNRPKEKEKDPNTGNKAINSFPVFAPGNLNNPNSGLTLNNFANFPNSQINSNQIPNPSASSNTSQLLSNNFVGLSNHFNNNPENNENNLPYPDYTLKKTEHLINKKLKTNLEIEKFSATNEELVDLEGRKKKIVKKDRKDELAKKFKNIQDKVYEMGTRINQPKDDQKIEEKALEDTVKGSFIKVLPCIQLTKYDNTFCYDHINKLYFIVCNGSLSSITILVSSTFEEKSTRLTELINQNYKVNLDNLFSDENLNFNDFTINLQSIILLLQSKKPDLYWKYKNWNYYFNHLLENLNNRPRELVYEGSFANEYCYPLLAANNLQINPNTLKILMNKVEKSSEFNEKIIKSQMPELLFTDFKLEISQMTSHYYANACPKFLQQNSSKSQETSWTHWNNSNNINFSLEEGSSLSPEHYDIINKLDNKFIFLENTKSFYFSIDSEEESFKILLKSLNEAYQSKNSSEIHRTLLFIYFWIENSINLPLLNKNNKFPEEIISLRKTLSEILDLNDTSLSNLVYVVILSGWEILLNDLTSQVEWFYKIYNSSKYKNSFTYLYKQLSADMEMNILNLDLNSPFKNPFNILLKKISFDNSLNLNYNFTKINMIKAYQFTVQEEKKTKRLRVEAKPSSFSINPKSVCYPLHWIILGYNIKTFPEAKKKAEEIINLKEDIFVNDIFSNSESDEEKDMKSTFFKCIEKSNFIDKSIPLSFFKNRLEAKFSDKDFPYGFKKITKGNTNNNFDGNNCSIKLTEEEFKSLSKDFWQFLESEIILNKNPSLLALLTDFFLMCTGDVNEFALFNVPVDSVHDLKDNSYYQNYFAFLESNFDFLRKIINCADNYSLSSILLYANNVLTSIYSKIKKSPIKIIQELQDKLSLLINEFSSLKIFKLGDENILNNLQTLSNTGYLQEKEKSFEYNLGSDMVQIYETIQFQGCNSIVVELELKSGKDKPFNYDLIVVSNEHTYSNMKFNTNNNYNNFGTCFLMKLHSNLSKKLFLSGDEIKIISPSELEFNKGSYGRSKYSAKPGQNAQSSQNCKSVLKIKCYPFANTLFGYSKDKAVNVKGKITNLIEMLRDMDYYTSSIIKNFIKSIDSRENEYENSIVGVTGNNTMLSETIVRQGLNTYKNVEQEFIQFSNNKLFNQPSFDDSFDITQLCLNNNEKKNLFTNYLNNIQVFSEDIKSDMEAFLSFLTQITNTDLDENGANSENKNIISEAYATTLSSKILSKLRDILKEPTEYTSMKKIPTFNNSPQLKYLWHVLEHIFITCLLYHLNMYKEISSNSAYPFSKFHVEMIGKKLNSLLTWMSNRVKTMKDTFDNLKSYLIDIVDTNNNFLDNIKALIIDKIKRKREEEAKIEEDKKNANKEGLYHGNAKKRNSHESLKSSFVSKTPNFKKKQNVKRLYQEIPKKKREHSKSINYNKLGKQEQEKDAKIADEESISIEELQAQPFKFFLNNYDKLVFEFLNTESYRKMKEEIKAKIESDIKEAYYGNADKLKNILEINGLQFVENNLQESLKNYTNFMFKSISIYYNFDDPSTPEEINSDKILRKLYSESPYYKMAFYILERLLFLLELNHIEEDTSSYTEEDLTQKKLTSGSSHDLHSPTRDQSTKAYLKKHDEDFFLSISQQGVIKSLFSFIYKSSNINELRVTMQHQYVRMRIREIGIKSYCKFLSLKEYEKKVNSKVLSKLFLNNIGSVCFSVRKSLLSGVETASHLNLIEYSDINLLLNYYFQNFNEHLKLYENSKNIKDLRIIKQTNNTTSSDYVKIEEITCYRLRNLILILSDIFVLVKYLAEANHNKCANLFEYDHNLEKFILSSTKFLFSDLDNKETVGKMNKLKTEFSDNLRLILSKLVGLGLSNNKDDKIHISDLVLHSLYQSLDQVMKERKIDLITNVLDVIYYISPFINLSIKLNDQSSEFTESSLFKLMNKLLELIIKSETYETVSLSCKICKSLIKSSSSKLGLQSLNTAFFDSIYERLGRLFLFKNKKQEETTNNAKYFVIVQMNSPEIDYQFLINALFYWEEKYPTKLSLYNYREFSDFVSDKNKEKDILDLYGLNNNPNISANININNSGQKIKMFNYFNPLKSKTTKMNLLEKIADERIANLRKAIEEGTKLLNSKSESATNSKLSQDNLESIKDRILRLRQQEAYQCRVKAHIKTAELIGETACTRGFVCLEPAMTREIAEELAEVIHKAYNRLLPHFKANIEETVNLFSDDLIYPKMPEKEHLLPGCTNTLKETTQSFMNVSLFEESVYERFDSTLKTFTDSAKKLALATNYQEEKRTKIGYYNNNYLLNYSLNLISGVNFNDSSINRIIESNCLSGISVSMIIEDMLNLVYTTFDTESKSNELIKTIRIELLKMNKSNWTRNTSEESKMKIVGLLLVISGYYNILRNNSKALFKQNPDDVCKILSGGHKTGKNHSHVIFLKEKGVKLEKVNNKDLEKMKMNTVIVNAIGIIDIVDALINTFEIYQENKDNVLNKLLLHLVLKILTEKNFENEMINLIENERETEFRLKIGKFVEILRVISSETLWLEKEDSFWETEFIDSFERIYNRMDVNAEKIYAPVFDISYLASQKVQFHPIVADNAVNSDLITKFQLPESNFIKQLPKITDLSKCTTALKNIQNFDRYLVGEIYQYNAKQWREDDFLNAFYQIRNYLSIGDIPNAYADLNQILDGAKIPAYMFPPKEHFDTKEITKEECYPSNYYMAKLSNKFIRDSGIKSLIKQGGIGINEIPVLMLLHDNTINQALVLYNDIEYGKLYTFWTPIDSLMFLEHQIKIPSNSFKMSELIKEYKYLEKRLRILYSKNVLSNVMKLLATSRKMNSFDELMYFLSISDWRTYRYNPTSGPFHNFKNYISVRQIKCETHILKSKSNTELNSSSNLFNLSEVLSSASHIEKNSSLSAISTNKKQYEINLEKVLSGLLIENSSASELIIQWCMNNWELVDKTFMKIKANLFNEFNVNYNENLRSRNIFHMGNFNHKMLALHELCEIDISRFAGIVLTFEKEAFLGPHAKLSFYSDPYGENIIHEIISIKTTKNNLESVVFNYPKVWMYYTPGTRAFSIFEWFLQSRDSNLPCSLVYVPHTWTTLISLTDYCTSSLFVDFNRNSLKVFEKLIRKLMVHCTNLSLPADLQRRIFNLTNRAILKVSKYLSILESQKKIKLSEMSISQKFNIIGIDEFAVTQLINNINNFNNINNNSTSGDKNFSSTYIVEGVEIILSLLSVIKESYNSLDQYLKDTFDYTLPVWIEAIIKLGQFLNFFQGTSALEGILMKEIYDQLSISSQFEKLITIQNIPLEKDDNHILTEIRKLLHDCNAKIVDVNKDIQLFPDTKSHTKTVVILTDGLLIDNLKEFSEEEAKPEPAEDPLWECFFCHMENDKENTFCIFCDKNKKVKPKEVKKEKPKSTLIKINTYLKTYNEKMNILITYLKNSNVLTEYEVKEQVVEEVLVPTIPIEEIPVDTKDFNVNYVKQTLEEQIDNLFEEDKPVLKMKVYYKSVKKRSELNVCSGEDIKNKKNMNEILNEFFRLRMKEYVREEDYIKDKLRSLEGNLSVQKYIANELEILKNVIFANNENKEINYVKIYEILQNNGVDFWLENVVLDSQSRNSEINIDLIVKLRELVDIKVCKEKNLSLILPALNLRFVPTNFDSINHSSMNLLENYYQELKSVPLSVIRFYWAIIKYFNNCLVAALPFIKPPDAYIDTREVANTEEEGYTRIAFPKTISAFLSTARGITFSVTKLNLIKEIISNTEFNEEEVQIPTFKFERLNIQSNKEKNISKKNNKSSTSNNMMMYPNMPKRFYRGLDEISEEEIINKEIICKGEITNEESMFLQTYEQAKEVDPAFFRSKKVPGDPHVCFKVEFKGELVQGIGGPYRQFFSDVSAELQDKEYKNKKCLQLFIPTQNNAEQKGEYKDRWTINPSYNSNTALNHFEFLGTLMGICIRTGVHLTLDICSLIWKKIIGEPITLEDIKQFDEGLYNRIEYLTDPSLTEETFENEDETFSTRLTDESLYEFITEGAEKRVTFEDRFKYLELLIKARLCESDCQIEALKNGLCKIIPESLLKLLTYRELERLICGVKKVDIDLLRFNTKLSQDLTESTNKVKWLWEILSEFSEEEKIKFVKFCWAQERLPSTQEEFAKLQVIFTIKSYIDRNRKDVFPRADTCFFSIELPEYSSKEVMKRMILQAITLDNITINGDKAILDNVRGVDYGGVFRSTYMDADDSDSDIYRY